QLAGDLPVAALEFQLTLAERHLALLEVDLGRHELGALQLGAGEGGVVELLLALLLLPLLGDGPLELGGVGGAELLLPFVVAALLLLFPLPVRAPGEGDAEGEL